MTVRIRIVATGETGTVDENAASPRVIELDDGTRRVVDGSEKVQVIPPGWDLAPSVNEPGREACGAPHDGPGPGVAHRPGLGGEA